jgi:hypothetical protein
MEKSANSVLKKVSGTLEATKKKLYAKSCARPGTQSDTVVFPLRGRSLRLTAKRLKRSAGGQRSATTGLPRTMRLHPETGARIVISVIPSG